VDCEALVFAKGPGFQNAIATESGISAASPSGSTLNIVGGNSYQDPVTLVRSGVAGDINVLGGDGGNGGRILIIAGQITDSNSIAPAAVVLFGGSVIPNGTTSDGGPVQIQGGNGGEGGDGGAIIIEGGGAGNSGNSRGGKVQIRGGTGFAGGLGGGDVAIIGGAGSMGQNTVPGKVTIQTFKLIPSDGMNDWEFATTGALTVPGPIIPKTNIAYDLGSATKRFRAIYLSNTIHLGSTAISVNSSGQLAMTESYIVTPPNVPGISISAYWTTNSLVFQVDIAIADKFDSLKVGDKITLLTGEMPANTVLTVTGPATSPKTVIQNSYYVYTIPVNSSPSTVRPSVDTFSITRVPANGVSSLNGYAVFPTVTAPSHSYGVAGDVAGMVAFDSTYIYYCTANYVNNTTNIWKRTAHGTGTW
jgi:hypothetical protein